MKTLEYRMIDKSAWADGPWHHEPDKRQWQDPATGLFCVVLRNPITGSLCGYCGVPPDHPAYGLDYNGITDAEAQANKKAFREDTRRWAAAGYPPLNKWWAKHPMAPSIDDPFPGIGEALQKIEVHGGLTYCGESHQPTRATWEKFKRQLKRAAADAKRFPRGDAARFILYWGETSDDYEGFVKRFNQTMVCCEVEADEPPVLWFFGFDCAHAFDISPGIDAMMDEIGQNHLREARRDLGLQEVYRDLAYVEAEVTGLAKQLAALYVPISLTT